MAGVKGMYHKKPDAKAIRKMVWNSMRILRSFTIPDLIRTVPGAKYANVRKFIHGMTRHGIVSKGIGFTGGRVGDFQKFILNKKRAELTGPVYPTICDICGEPLTEKICDHSKKKETKRKKEKEREKEENIETEGIPSEEIDNDNDRPDATAS